jgi:hypothetical protein
MPARQTSSFVPARAKLRIASIDVPALALQAQYNPKELQIDKQIPWNDHNNRDNRTGTKRPDSSTQSDLEFNGVAKRTMQIELLFDGYEKGESVEPQVERLEQLSTVQHFTEPEEERRPHHCLVAWGAHPGGMRPFPCVIESLSTKYTMWDANGMALRATCTVKLKEAERMSRSRR